MDRTLLDRALIDTAPVRPLPDNIATLLQQVSAPPRLAAHLRAAHDVAWQLTDAMVASFPALQFNREDVLLGAATHDIGFQNQYPVTAPSSPLPGSRPPGKDGPR